MRSFLEEGVLCALIGVLKHSEVELLWEGFTKGFGGSVEEPAWTCGPLLPGAVWEPANEMIAWDS